jgi:hypothetical protein
MSITDEVVNDIEREKGIKAYIDGLKEKDFILNIDTYSESFRTGYLEMQRMDWEKKHTHSKDLELIRACEEAQSIPTFGLYEDIENLENKYNDGSVETPSLRR